MQETVPVAKVVGGRRKLGRAGVWVLRWGQPRWQEEMTFLVGDRDFNN